MARSAGCGKTLELPHCGTLVAILALHRGVSPQEWEAILVILNLLHGNIPPEHGVTLRAIRPHLPLVNIGVTILALLADISKDRLNVALCALHFFVHAAQRILRLVVIEFWNCSDGAPAHSGVAVLTRNRERPVRTACSLPLRVRCSSARGRRGKKSQPACDLNPSKRNCPLNL